MKKNAKKVAECLAFILLLCLVFSRLTYLFRNSSIDRVRFVAFEDEARDSIDMVYIGASSVYVFWNPMVAWQQHGITSYDYSTSNMPGASFLPSIREIEKSQKPKVIVVDLRTFYSQVWNALSAEGVSGGYRSVSDSWDLSLSRAKAIAYYCKMNHVSLADSLSSYMDLIYYHTNHDILKNSRNWQLWDNATGGSDLTTDFKGFMANYSQTNRVAAFPEFVPPMADEEVPLQEDSERCFRDLLEYAVSNKIPLLVTSTPFIIDEQKAMETNAFSRIASEYGVPLLNTNTPEIWDEMGLDPMTDFYNGNHLNVMGSEKFTSYLAGYLVENFSLPDHRGEPEFASWQEEYDDEYIPYMEPLLTYARETSEWFKETYDDEERMLREDDAAKWLSLADNENVTLLLSAGSPMENKPSDEASLALKNFGLSEYLDGGDSFIGVYSGKILYQDVAAKTYAGATETLQNPASGHSVNYSFSLEGNPAITINDEIYQTDAGGAISIMAIDNNLAKPVDFVTLNITESGDLAISHLEL